MSELLALWQTKCEGATKAPALASILQRKATYANNWQAGLAQASLL
jgi:hypothetical protein